MHCYILCTVLMSVTETSWRAQSLALGWIRIKGRIKQDILSGVSLSHKQWWFEYNGTQTEATPLAVCKLKPQQLIFLRQILLQDFQCSQLLIGPQTSGISPLQDISALLLLSMSKPRSGGQRWGGSKNSSVETKINQIFQNCQKWVQIWGNIKRGGIIFSNHPSLTKCFETQQANTYWWLSEPPNKNLLNYLFYNIIKLGW